MSDLPPVIPVAAPPTPPSAPAGTRRIGKKTKGFFPPEIVRAVSFYIISLCIIASVVVCILAIWDFAKKDSLWRLVASFLVVGAGTALFAVVNSICGEEPKS
jgi:hypothetical protein